MDLLTIDEVNSIRIIDNPYIAQYDFIRQTRLPLLHKAYERITSDLQDEIDVYVHNNEYW